MRLGCTFVDGISRLLGVLFVYITGFILTMLVIFMTILGGLSLLFFGDVIRIVLRMAMKG